MDRIAIISDIHGNMPAFQAVLKDIKNRNINRIFCLGDLAGKGPSSSEVVDLTMTICEEVIKGNWDHFLSVEDENHQPWHREKLGEKRLSYLRNLSMYKEFYMSGRLIRLCHASPNDLYHRTFISSSREDRLKLFEATQTMAIEADVVGYGDIHGAHIEFFEGKTIFNVGSVGNPLEITQASYAIIEGVMDSKTLSPFMISLARVPYDIELAVMHAEASDMPDKEHYIHEITTAQYRRRK